MKKKTKFSWLSTFFFALAVAVIYLFLQGTGAI